MEPARAILRRLVPADAAAYRQLMLQAYAAHPDAFTSSVAERSSLPLAWWESRLAAPAAIGDAVNGEQLVQALLDHARSRPAVGQVLLTVRQGNAAATDLYTRCGFVPWGVEPRAVEVEGGFVSRVHMLCRV